MTPDKDIIVYSASLNLGRKGTGVLMKVKGVYTPADLSGTWILQSDGTFSLSADKDGKIISCSFVPVAGEPALCNGTISLVPEGDISGRIEVAGTPFAIDFNGQMSRNKKSMLLAGGISTRFEGMATLGVKREGFFPKGDGTNVWKIFLNDLVDCRYGSVHTIGSGTITGGEWASAQAKNGTFTGGSISISEHGDISGSISTSTGDTYAIAGGQIISTGDLAVLLVKNSTNHYGVAILAKAVLAR
jgi:hypothetical protein